jgi:hypothetical protein
MTECVSHLHQRIFFGRYTFEDVCVCCFRYFVRGHGADFPFFVEELWSEGESLTVRVFPRISCLFFNKFLGTVLGTYLVWAENRISLSPI